MVDPTTLKVGEKVVFTDGEFKGLEGNVIETFWVKVNVVKIHNHPKIATIKLESKVDSRTEN